MLGHWIPSSRNRFTGADFDFVASVLAPCEQRLHLEKLWIDQDAQREILDLKEVFRGLLDSPAAIRVSPHFYFYVLVRHSFMQADLSDADLAAHIAWDIGAAAVAQRLSERLDATLLDSLVLGLAGRPCSAATQLRDQDRLELLRPLQVDPKEARRLRYRRDGLKKVRRSR